MYIVDKNENMSDRT